MIQVSPAYPAQFIGRNVALSFSEYEAAISAEYGPLKLELTDPGKPFQSALSARRLGWMKLSRVFASSGFSGLRKSGASRDEREHLILMHVEDGVFSVAQHGRETLCEPNSLVLMDCDSPMDAVQMGSTRALAFKIPKGILRAHHAGIDGSFASAVAAGSGSAAVLRDLMDSMWRNYYAFSKEELERLPSSLINLVGLVFMSTDDATGEASAMTFQFKRIERAIIAHLHSPNLTPAMIAGELGISKSYLYAVTHWAGTTFGRMVMEHRLDRCRATLADPGEFERSITDIALGWGFQSPSHFSRRFTAHFGTSPSQFRQQIMGELRQKTQYGISERD